MAVFLVLGEDRADLGAAVKAKFPGDSSLDVAPGQWLVSGNYTPQGVSDYLGTSEGAFGRVMVSMVTSYFGWHGKNIWDWVALKSQANG